MLFNVHRLKLAAAWVGLATAVSAVSAQDAPPASDELLVPGLSLSPMGRSIGPRALPNVDLSAEILFQVLASEVAAQRGAFDPPPAPRWTWPRKRAIHAWRAARSSSRWPAAT